MHKSTWSLLATAWIGLVSVFTQVQAQTPQQKLEYIRAVTQGAGQLMEEGKPAQARLALLSVLTEVQHFLPAANQSPVKELFADYMQARNAAWPDAPAQLTAEALQHFLDAFRQQNTELLRLAKLFNPESQSYPNGVKAYHRHVADILGQRQHAYTLAGELAMQAPPPDQLVTNRQVFMALFEQDIPKALHNITFGPVIAAAHAQQRVIPENLKAAGEALSKAAAQQRAGDARLALNEARAALDLVESIQAAMRKELDLSALLADLPGLEAEYDKQNRRADALYEQEVDDNRMPAAKSWKAGPADAAAVLAEARAVYQGLFPDHVVLDQNLQSPEFGERWESWWDHDTLLTAYYGYVLVATASKAPSGESRVRVQRYRRTRNADGGWSGLGAYDTLYSFPVREKNI